MPLSLRKILKIRIERSVGNGVRLEYTMHEISALKLQYESIQKLEWSCFASPCMQDYSYQNERQFRVQKFDGEYADKCGNIGKIARHQHQHAPS